MKAHAPKYIYSHFRTCLLSGHVQQCLLIEPIRQPVAQHGVLLAVAVLFSSVSSHTSYAEHVQAFKSAPDGIARLLNRLNNTTRTN